MVKSIIDFCLTAVGLGFAQPSNIQVPATLNHCRFLSDKSVACLYESQTPETIPELGNPMNAVYRLPFGHFCTGLLGSSNVGNEL
jgi:hypothetical protein